MFIGQATILRPKSVRQIYFGYQGSDSPAGTQALPVGNIIKAKVYRKNNPKVSQICIC